MKSKLLEDIRENPQNLFNLIAGATGLFFGTLDAVTTGFPLFTAGVPIYEAVNYWSAPKNIKEGAKNIAGDLKPSLLDSIKRSLVYGLYASIPFTVKYHEELIDLFRY